MTMDQISHSINYLLSNHYNDHQNFVDLSPAALKQHLKVILKRIVVDNKHYSWLSFRKGGPYNATIIGIDNNYLIIFDIAHQGDEDFDDVLLCY